MDEVWDVLRNDHRAPLVIGGVVLATVLLLRPWRYIGSPTWSIALPLAVVGVATIDRRCGVAAAVMLGVYVVVRLFSRWLDRRDLDG